MEFSEPRLYNAPILHSVDQRGREGEFNSELTLRMFEEFLEMILHRVFRPECTKALQLLCIVGEIEGNLFVVGLLELRNQFAEKFLV